MTKLQTRQWIQSQTMEFMNNGGTVKRVGHRVNRSFKSVALTPEQVSKLPKNIRELVKNIKWKNR